MRLLFLADAVFEDLPGGSRMAARELALGLAGRGHEVTFLVTKQTPGAPENEWSDSIRIVRYGGAGKAAQYIRSGRAACATLWAEKPFDLVHTHFAYSSVGPLRAVPPATPRVRTFHGPWDEEGWLEERRSHNPISLMMASSKRILRYQIEADSLRGSAIVLTLSDCFAKLATKRYGVKPHKISIVPGGTDTTRFCPPADKTAVRQQLGLPLNRTILLSIRRLAPRMGLDNLILAMPGIVQRHPEIQLLIGGKGPEEKRLAGMIETMGLKQHVRLIGFIPDELLAAQYQAADLFVLPTIALEGFGLVTTEALACGVPVIGTPVGAIPETLRDLDPRLISGGSAPASIGISIKEFLEGDWKDSLTPERLHRYVEDRYTWDRHVEAIEKVYSEVLSA